MAALWNRQSDFVENAGISFRKIQNSVMCWIEFPSSWECALHRQRNPMPEFQSFIKISGEMQRKTRQSVYEQSSAWDKDAHALVEPLLAP